MVRYVLQMPQWLFRLFAWFFAVGTATLLGVCWARLMFLPGADRHTTMMSDGRTDAWGLTYLGRPGAVLALAELILVVGAMWASANRRRSYRAMGHLLLILWAGLWTANAFYVFVNGAFGLIYVMPFFFVCTCVRAAVELTPPRTLALAGRPA